jgi:hypothetical protein
MCRWISVVTLDQLGELCPQCWHRNHTGIANLKTLGFRHDRCRTPSKGGWYKAAAIRVMAWQRNEYITRIHVTTIEGKIPRDHMGQVIRKRINAIGQPSTER